MKIKSGMGRGRKTPRAFFWVEWDPGAAVPGDAVLVMAERAGSDTGGRS